MQMKAKLRRDGDILAVEYLGIVVPVHTYT